MKKSVLHQAGTCMLWVFLLLSTFDALAQSVTISVNATQNKRLISPYLYGRNESFDRPVQFYKDAGLRFARMNGGNNASGYNWRKRLSIHPDWYNNVYTNDWDALAQNIQDNFPEIQGMFAFQLLGRVASNTQHNFDDWSFNQSQYWSGHGQNLAGGGVPDESGGSKALVDGDIDLFSQPWPTDSSVAILDHWFGPNGKGFYRDQFRYWSMDNEADIWDGTHDYAMPALISASAFMDRYIELAKKAKALYPGIRLCGPVTTSEWQWYKWSNESIYVDGRYYPWIEYFIKRLGDEYKATGIKLVDVVDIHNYPWYNGDDAAALQGHRIYYDETYDYPGSNGIRTSTGGWDSSLTKQYIFTRIDNWLTEHFGASHGITAGLSEWGTMSGSDANLESVIYASHLGTFANHGVEFFSPWNWSVGMWETLHLFSRNAKKYSVSSTSSDENSVSAYSSVNESSDSLTVIIVNRDMAASRTVAVNLSNFDVVNGNYNTLQLSSLPANETFVSHTQNALKTNTVAVNSNSLTLTVPALSTTAILLTKAKSKSSRYAMLANAATGMYMDGMFRSDQGADAGQWVWSGSDAQQWSIDTVGSYVLLKNRATGLYLDGMGRTTNGQAAGQRSQSGNDMQQWQVVTSGSNVKFRNKATGQYLDGLGNTNNGSILGQWKKSNHKNQQWSISFVETLAGAMRGSVVMESVPREPKLEIYPNPFAKDFKLEVPATGQPFEIVLFDPSGKTVEQILHSGEAGIVSLGAALTPGLYLVTVKGVDWSQSFRIVKE